MIKWPMIGTHALAVPTCLKGAGVPLLQEFSPGGASHRSSRLVAFTNYVHEFLYGYTLVDQSKILCRIHVPDFFFRAQLRGEQAQL